MSSDLDSHQFFRSLAAATVVFAMLLAALYTRIVGAGSGRARPIWLKSVRDTAGPRSSSAPTETVLIGSVALAVLVLVLWFFVWSAGAVPNAPLG